MKYLFNEYKIELLVIAHSLIFGFYMAEGFRLLLTRDFKDHLQSQEFLFNTLQSTAGLFFYVWFSALFLFGYMIIKKLVSRNNTGYHIVWIKEKTIFLTSVALTLPFWIMALWEFHYVRLLDGPVGFFFFINFYVVLKYVIFLFVFVWIFREFYLRKIDRSIDSSVNFRFAMKIFSLVVVLFPWVSMFVTPWLFL